MVSRWMGTPPSGSGLLNMWIGAHLKIPTIAMSGTTFATMNKMKHANMATKAAFTGHTTSMAAPITMATMTTGT